MRRKVGVGGFAGPHDPIGCLDQSADLGGTVVSRDVRPLVAQQVPPILESYPGRPEPPTERVPEVMDPDGSEAGRRFHPEPLPVPLCGSLPGPVPAGRTKVTQWRAPRRRDEDEPAMATASSLKDGLGGIVENDYARLAILHNLRRQCEDTPPAARRIRR